jgi:hypothetical protein
MILFLDLLGSLLVLSWSLPGPLLVSLWVSSSVSFGLSLDLSLGLSPSPRKSYGRAIRENVRWVARPDRIWFAQDRSEGGEGGRSRTSVLGCNLYPVFLEVCFLGRMERWGDRRKEWAVEDGGIGR